MYKKAQIERLNEPIRFSPFLVKLKQPTTINASQRFLKLTCGNVSATKQTTNRFTRKEQKQRLDT